MKYRDNTYHGFQFGGKGATIPSRAINNRSLSLIGSIPIDPAYSNISETTKKYFKIEIRPHSCPRILRSEVCVMELKEMVSAAWLL